MNGNNDKKLSRRSILKGAALLAGVAAVPMALTSKEAMAAASKAAMQYQDKPKDGKQCSGCMFFKPGASASAMGTCQAVAGAISPHGWCLAFTPKTK